MSEFDRHDVRLGVQRRTILGAAWAAPVVVAAAAAPAAAASTAGEATPAWSASTASIPSTGVRMTTSTLSVTNTTTGPLDTVVVNVTQPAELTVNVSIVGEGWQQGQNAGSLVIFIWAGTLAPGETTPGAVVTFSTAELMPGSTTVLATTSPSPQAPAAPLVVDWPILLNNPSQAQWSWNVPSIAPGGQATLAFDPGPMQFGSPASFIIQPTGSGSFTNVSSTTQFSSTNFGSVNYYYTDTPRLKLFTIARADQPTGTGTLRPYLSYISGGSLQRLTGPDLPVV
ncbi:hypothetical protein [Herbiconiux sp. A18JL235]|uniref:Uncharacterized protein n=1 Tax=Herbiconiux sp. A18JL235 TaxID=3152363 RepID=A0AB39BDD5_9MICO